MGVGETRRDGRRPFVPCFLLLPRPWCPFDFSSLSFPIFVPSSPLGDMCYIDPSFSGLRILGGDGLQRLVSDGIGRAWNRLVKRRARVESTDK